MSRFNASGLLIYKPDAQAREAQHALACVPGFYCYVNLMGTIKSTGR